MNSKKQYETLLQQHKEIRLLQYEYHKSVESFVEQKLRNLQQIVQQYLTKKNDTGTRMTINELYLPPTFNWLKIQRFTVVQLTNNLIRIQSGDNKTYTLERRFLYYSDRDIIKAVKKYVWDGVQDKKKDILKLQEEYRLLQLQLKCF